LRPQLYGKEGFGLAVGLVGSEADRRAATSTGLAPAVTRLNERWVVRPSGRAYVAKGAGSGAIGCGHPSHQSPTPSAAVPGTKIPLDTVTFQRPRCIEQWPTRPAIRKRSTCRISTSRASPRQPTRRDRAIETLAPPWLAEYGSTPCFVFDCSVNNLFCTRGAHGNDCLGVLRPLSRTSRT